MRGTYAIAPLENHTLDSSPEALITCIIKVLLGGDGETGGPPSWCPMVFHSHVKQCSQQAICPSLSQVDLKGVCGDQSWMRPFADALGWTDAFLDRILMTVILIRDEVEHSRFSLKPLSLITSAGSEAERVREWGQRGEK